LSNACLQIADALSTMKNQTLCKFELPSSQPLYAVFIDCMFL
jgi:hypothetical protein